MKEIQGVLLLPVEVLSVYVMPHLDVRDMQALDTAYTAAKDRSHLKHMWRRMANCSLPPISWQHALPSLVWLRNNAFSVDSLVFNAIKQQTYNLETITYLAANFSTLQQLRFVGDSQYSGLWFHDRHLKLIAQGCSHLQTLVAPETSVTEEGLIFFFQRCHDLRQVVLNSNISFRRSLEVLCASCPHLTHIDISKAYKLSPTSFHAIVAAYPYLHTLKIISNHVTQGSGQLIAASCKQLRVFHCSRLRTRDIGLEAIWEANRHLSDVDISFNRVVTNSDILHLVQCCPSIEILNIRMCNNISDSALMAIAQHCHLLTSIDLEFCLKITYKGVIAIVQRCSNLSPKVKRQLPFQVHIQHFTSK